MWNSPVLRVARANRLPEPVTEVMTHNGRSTGGRESWHNHNSWRWIHQPFDGRSQGSDRRAQIGVEGFCRPISRVLYPPRKGRTVTIYLAQPPAVKPAKVRHWRSDVTAAVKQPTRGLAGHLSPPIWPCSRWGLAAVASPQTTGRSYRPISPLPFHCWKDGMFLCHFPSPNRVLPPPRGAWELPSTLPRGARTFLPPSTGEERRSPGLHDPPIGL